MREIKYKPLIIIFTGRLLVKTLIVLCMNIMVSCEDFVDINPPRTEVINETVFSNDEAALSTVNGIYSLMMTNISFTRAGLEQYTGLYSDELINLSFRTEDAEFAFNNLVPENGNVFQLFWQEPYVYINNANVILEGLGNATGITDLTRQQLRGEALFIRAFCHFYLVNLFGDVPYITSTDFEVNSRVTREPVTQIYEQIVMDLLKATELLVDDFSFANGERIRPNKSVATALLARVYLYNEEWVKAEEQATMIIEQVDVYGLEDNLNNVFVSSSRETIWQLKPVIPNTNTPQGDLFVLEGRSFGGFINPVYLSQNVVNDFETNDNRRMMWIGEVDDGGNTFHFPNKYKIRGTLEPLTEYSVVFRLAEQYLIRAEARTQQNNITGAQQDLNVIRNRSGLGDTPASDPDSLLTAIEKDRRVELFAEWGHRWFDLKRTGRVDAILSAIPEKDWQSTDVLWPIPEQEILNNPNLLPQNLGY